MKFVIGGKIKQLLNQGFSQPFFIICYWLILLWVIFDHSYWSVILGLLTLIIWKFFKGLAWHNLFYLLVLGGLLINFRLWANILFLVFYLFITFFLFYLQLIRLKSNNVWVKILAEAFNYVLFYYFILFALAQIYLFHKSWGLVFLVYLFLLFILVYWRLFQLKIKDFSPLIFLLIILFNAELFYLVTLVPLNNYLRQTLVLLIGYYISLRLIFIADQKKNLIWFLLLLILMILLLI